MAEEVECCQLRRGVTVVVRCCTCAPEDLGDVARSSK